MQYYCNVIYKPAGPKVENAGTRWVVQYRVKFLTDDVWLSIFWNRLDFLIRIGYCKTGPVSKLLSCILFWKLYSSNYVELDAKFDEMVSILKNNGVSIEGKTVLELGPGNSYVNALNFLMYGADEVILLDKYPRNKNDKKQKEIFEKEIDLIARKYGKGASFIQEELEKKCREVVADVTEVELKNVDFIYSNSVLEHIRNIRETVSALTMILNKGGYMFHNIDLRDHFNFKEPFLFYKYSEWVWENLLTKEGISYVNRLRYGDFIRLFEENKLRVVSEKTEKRDLDHFKLSKEFSVRELVDLETTYLQILLRKSF